MARDPFMTCFILKSSPRMTEFLGGSRSSRSRAVGGQPEAIPRGRGQSGASVAESAATACPSYVADDGSINQFSRLLCHSPPPCSIITIPANPVFPIYHIHIRPSENPSPLYPLLSPCPVLDRFYPSLKSVCTGSCRQHPPTVGKSCLEARL